MGTHPIFESDFDCLTVVFRAMSFQWQFVAIVLYIEIGITLLLCLSFISSKWWSALFKSGLAKAVASNGSTIFYILASILGLFFVDAVRDVKKYDETVEDTRTHTHDLAAINQALMYKFRAQRNLYISGFALFLWIVIKRLAGLLSDKARTKAEAAAAKAQAESASRTAELLIDQQKEKEEKGEEGVEDDIKKEIADLKKRLEAAQKRASSEEKAAKEAEDQLKQKDAELLAMKKQSESLANEYDRLTNEFSKLQNEQGAGDKKDE